MVITAGQYYVFVFHSGKNLAGKAIHSVNSPNQNVMVEWVESNGMTKIVHNSTFPASAISQVFQNGKLYI